MIKLILIQGDTFKAITHVKSNTIDLVILDPPYLVTEMPDVTNEIKDVLKKENINWFFLFRELSRVMKENSVLICFGHLSTFMELGRIIKKYFDYVTDIIWVKPFAVNFLKAKLKPLSQHETITVWKKGKLRYNYEEAKEKGEPYSRIRKETEKTSFYNVEYKNSENIGFRYMSDVIYAPHKPDMKFDERTEHPCQKPILLIEKLIKAFSFKNDVIFDPFLGSGTTMVVCRNLERNCIGIEINPDYIKMIKDRLSWGSSLNGIEWLFID